MSMKQVALFNFRSTTDGEQALAVVRYGDGCVALGLSSRSNGDAEVGMDKDLTWKLIEALKEAAEKAYGT